MTGTPTYESNNEEAPFPNYDRDGKQVQLIANGASVGYNSVNKTRCAWWKAHAN